MENVNLSITGINAASSKIDVDVMRFLSSTFDAMCRAYFFAQENYQNLDLTQYPAEVIELINIRKGKLSIIEQILDEEIAAYSSSSSDWVPSSKLNSFLNIMEPLPGYNPKIGIGPTKQ